MKFRIGISWTIVAAIFLAGQILSGANSELKPFIAPLKSPTADVPSLIKALGSQEGDVRSKAVAELSKVGEPAIPALMEALTDINSFTRKGTAEVLGNIGNAKPEIIPALIKMLTDRNIYVRQSAVESLDKIGEPAVPLILKALSDKDSYTRQGAAGALGNIKATSPGIIQALKDAVKDNNGNVRRSAAEALEKRKALTNEIKAMRYVLDLGDSNMSGDARIEAVEALDKIGPVIPEVMPAITSAFHDREYVVRKESVSFLEKRGLLTPALKAEKYICDLEYGKSVVRIKASEALGKLGPSTPEVVPALIGMMGDKEVCEAAIRALGEIGPEAKTAVPSLVKALSDSSGNVRAAAAESLGMIGPAAKTATPSLMQALNDKDHAVSSNSAKALRRLGVMTADKRLGYLISSHPFLSVLGGLFASIILFLAGWFGVPMLWKLCFPLNWYIRELHHPDDKRRAVAVEALAKIGNSSIPFVIKMLDNDSGDVRVSAAEALNEFSSLPPQAMTLIMKSLNDKEDEVRRNIIEILGKPVPADTEILLELAKALEDGNSGVRMSAATALGKNGPAKESVAAFKKAIEDSSSQVRELSYNALENYNVLTTDLRVKRFIADLKDRDISVSEKAGLELANIGSAVIPELIKVLDNHDSNVRKFAAAFLEQNDAMTVELRIKRYLLDLGDNQINIVMKAAEGLGDIGVEASEAIPNLSKLIASNDYYVRYFAAQALEKMGAMTPELKAKRESLDRRDGAGAAKRSKNAEPAYTSG